METKSIVINRMLRMNRVRNRNSIGNCSASSFSVFVFSVWSTHSVFGVVCEKKKMEPERNGREKGLYRKTPTVLHT